MERKRNITLLVMMVAAVLVLAACASSGEGLAGTSWQLVEMNGQLVRQDIDVTLNFEDEQQISGSAGCNSYGGGYSIDGSSITFSQVFSTEMACMDETVMNTESTFLDALNAGGTYEHLGDSLTINAANGTTLTFTQGS